MPHYLYIIYSIEYDKFYVGECENIEKRMVVHNITGVHNFTSKYRPWTIKALFDAGDRSYARKCESFIKKQKSKSFIRKIIMSECVLKNTLDKLVRVPLERD